MADDEGPEFPAVRLGGRPLSETMFARLVGVLLSETGGSEHARNADILRQHRSGKKLADLARDLSLSPPRVRQIVDDQTKREERGAAIVRALLTELRTIADDSAPGIITFPGILTTEQSDALRRNLWAKYGERPSVMCLPDDATYTPIALSPAAFIDAILAESGASGGA